MKTIVIYTVIGITLGLISSAFGGQEINIFCPDHRFLTNVDVDCISPNLSDHTPILRVSARSTINFRLNSTILADTGVDGDHVPLLYVYFPADPEDDFSDPTQFLERQSQAEEEYVDKLVGIALDGVPIYTALGFGGYDMLFGNVAEGIEPLAVDECGGTYGPTPDGTRYHYRTMPTCVLPLVKDGTRTNETANRIWYTAEYDEARYQYELRRMKYVSDPEDLLDGYLSTPGEKYPQVLGYTTTGHPIYSPYNSRGLLQGDLDNCNGKFDAEGNYGYYVKPTFPYVVGCFGPGVYNLGEEGIYSREWAPGATHNHRKWNACPRGYVPIASIDGGFETDAGCEPCAAGRYSTSSNSAPWRQQLGGAGRGTISDAERALFHNTQSKQGCNNVCPAGTYCPQASIAPTRCPAGRYGDSPGLKDESCSGQCRAGFYCPANVLNTRPNPYPCGGDDLYCPMGSGFPLRVDTGFYSVPEGADNHRHRQNQTICEPGYYCEKGVRQRCPAGRYGTVEGLAHRNCSAECPVGHYCPEGTPDPMKCPAGTFGESTGLSTAECTGLCRPGFYCPAGSIMVNQSACRAGIYGAEYGLTNSQCSPHCEQAGGPNTTSSEGNGRFCEVRACEAGYYCKEASSSPRNFDCGNASFYCPPSSGWPTPVDSGYYTIGPDSAPEQLQKDSDAHIRYSQILCERGYYCVHGVRFKCPGGYYGGETGLTGGTCSGMCTPGYICDEASPSPTQRVCGGVSVYCPEGSYNTTEVPAGYYSVGHDYTTRQSIQACEPGYWCSGGVKRICSAGRYSVSGSSTEECDGLCERGYWCAAGSSSATQHDCPAGRYGHLGMKSDVCKGSCMAGYYCPVNSYSATQHECGGENYYCPHGSGSPQAVSSGYFSAGNNATTRVEQIQCADTDYTGTPPVSNSRSNLCPATTVP